MPFAGTFRSILLDIFELWLIFISVKEKIEISSSEILSDNKYILKQVTFRSRNRKGEWVNTTREVYDRGDGATVLLYNKGQNTVILTRQFRLPAFLNASKTGMLIEACAGLLEDQDPEDCIRKEALEETGFKLAQVQKIFEAYMTPGAVTEKLHFFIAPYTAEMKTDAGGGLEKEHEDIEVLELDFDMAYGMVEQGEIVDSKTIMLLQYAKTSIFNNI